ncbi:MAG: NAD(P)-binding domain-containing protein [Planctomycetes bacterium]|nr:NAD(P)-binding domain-containing protein [Planctomycetota bacterium]
MTWVALLIVAAALAAAVWARRHELGALEVTLSERQRAISTGSNKARLQHPVIDLSRCIGCGLCVTACPEDDVIAMAHGQAIVVHGARCVGHGRCAEECPVGGIAVTLADLTERRDIPALNEHFESVTAPGIFLAGEVTGFALVRTAVAQGVAVATEVARRVRERVQGGVHGEAYDLVVVGAGPAGLACALKAKEQGLSFVVIEQEGRESDPCGGIGGTVAKYPRRKLVMTQPVELPLYGRLTRDSYSKEELMELWQKIVVEHSLPIITGQPFVGLDRDELGVFQVQGATRTVRGLHVCFALGRRGTPNKLGVEGEELSKVAYGLVDAQSFQKRRILVVGGGDSAVEAALGLSEQPGNAVTISYRKENFFRLKSRNEARLRAAVEGGKLHVVLASEVRRIEEQAVELSVGANGSARNERIPNDEVFVLAGGKPPFELLEKSGVSFDPKLRPTETAQLEQGAGVARALLAALLVTLVLGAWVLWRGDYYGLAPSARVTHPDHAALRSSGVLGITLGALAATAMLVNLSYLARRNGAIFEKLGSLRAWMTLHIATGILAFVLALAHSAFDARHTVGGHALIGLGVLVATGAVGRYFYSFVPRAANGRELALDEVKTRLAEFSASWDRNGGEFGERVRAEIARLVAESRPVGSFFARAASFARSRRNLTTTLDQLVAEGRELGVGERELAEMSRLARRAHQNALAAAHFEELRGLAATWRWFHRWVALLLVLLVVIHIIAAWRYAGLGVS